MNIEISKGIYVITGGGNSKEKRPSPAGGVPGGVPGGVKGEQGGEYRPVKSQKMDGSKRWLEFKRRPSPAEAGAEGRTTGVTGDANKPACQIRKDGWIKEMVGIQKAAFASRSWRRRKNRRRHRRRKTCMKIGRSRKNE